MLTKPKWLLRLEGAVLFVLALGLYRRAHYPWWLFLLFFLSPDLSMFAYFKNAKWGAASYNFFHTISIPLAVCFLGLFLPAPAVFPYALIWIAHVAFDRMLGYGLKYPTFFKDTHFQHI
jgi:hypothetical protein